MINLFKKKKQQETKTKEQKMAVIVDMSSPVDFFPDSNNDNL